MLGDAAASSSGSILAQGVRPIGGADVPARKFQVSGSGVFIKTSRRPIMADPTEVGCFSFLLPSPSHVPHLIAPRRCVRFARSVCPSGQDILQAHGWFSGFDWRKLEMKQLQAPHVPKISHPAYE